MTSSDKPFVMVSSAFYEFIMYLSFGVIFYGMVVVTFSPHHATNIFSMFGSVRYVSSCVSVRPLLLLDQTFGIKLYITVHYAV